jgi:hypothetical protein
MDLHSSRGCDGGVRQELAAASKMKKFIVVALGALVAAASSTATARDDEPSPEVIEEFASNYMRCISQNLI